MPEIEDGESEESQSVNSTIKSTKRPLSTRKRNRDNESVRSKAEVVMDEAISVLKDSAKKTQKLDDEDIFGQNIACGLRKVTDDRCREFAKVKLQEIIFQAQFGLLTPSNQHYHTYPNMAHGFQNFHTTPQQRHFVQSPSSSTYSNQQSHSPLASPTFPTNYVEQ